MGGGIIPVQGTTRADTRGMGSLRCSQVSGVAVGEAVGAETGVWLVGEQLSLNSVHENSCH